MLNIAHIVIKIVVLNPAYVAFYYTPKTKKRHEKFAAASCLFFSCLVTNETLV